MLSSALIMFHSHSLFQPFVVTFSSHDISDDLRERITSVVVIVLALIILTQTHVVYVLSLFIRREGNPGCHEELIRVLGKQPQPQKSPGESLETDMSDSIIKFLKVQ